MEAGSKVYTDNHRVHLGLREYSHETMKCSVGEYVSGEPHPNGIESFWPLLERSDCSAHRYMSEKHLAAVFPEIENRHGAWKLDTGVQISFSILAMEDKRFPYKELVQ